jgi:cytochrome c2
MKRLRDLGAAVWPIATIAAAAAVVGLTGCDLGPKANLDKGQQLFTQKCGSCHALTGAGTNGDIGPNLDYAFKQARASGMDSDTIKGVVSYQIAHARPAAPEQTDV